MWKVYAATPPATPPRTWQAIAGLVRETQAIGRPFDSSLLSKEARSHTSAYRSEAFTRAGHQLRFLQRKLAVGWGTARVAVGMAVASRIYEGTKSALEK